MIEQYQTNINQFINYIKDKINNDHNDMNTYELISEHLYNLIVANTKEENISIINYYSGSVINAINKHINIFGIFNFNDINDFYIKLAFCSVYELLCDEVDKELNNDTYSNASTIDNEDEDI
jgi:hypothetical protein